MTTNSPKATSIDKGLDGVDLITVVSLDFGLADNSID